VSGATLTKVISSHSCHVVKNTPPILAYFLSARGSPLLGTCSNGRVTQTDDSVERLEGRAESVPRRCRLRAGACRTVSRGGKTQSLETSGLFRAAATRWSGLGPSSCVLQPQCGERVPMALQLPAGCRVSLQILLGGVVTAKLRLSQALSLWYFAPTSPCDGGNLHENTGAGRWCLDLLAKRIRRRRAVCEVTDDRWNFVEPVSIFFVRPTKIG